MLPDRYGYAYGPHRLGPGEVVLACTPSGPVPLPARLPEVVWRAGIDLDPIDVADPGSGRWLESLVWPEAPGVTPGVAALDRDAPAPGATSSSLTARRPWPCAAPTGPG